MTVIDAFPWARWHPSFGKRLQTIIDYNFGPAGCDDPPRTGTRSDRPISQAPQARAPLATNFGDKEPRGYLDPDRRGERLDECGAIEMFLADALPKSR